MIVKKPRAVIGIDPDVSKSGFAYAVGGELIEYKALRFYDLLSRIKQYSENDSFNLQVVIEGGWLIKKSNWHGAKNKAVAGRIGKNVGENHGTGKLIAEFCETEKINHLVVKPTGSKDAKRACVVRATGLNVRNQDIVDAIYLTLGRS